jgi:hypothetical protein
LRASRFKGFEFMTNPRFLLILGSVLLLVGWTIPLLTLMRMIPSTFLLNFIGLGRVGLRIVPRIFRRGDVGEDEQGGIEMSDAGQSIALLPRSVFSAA